MKITIRCWCIALTGMLLAVRVSGDTRETVMTFPSPEKQGILRIVSGIGDITVTGYDGTEVEIIADSEGQLGEDEETNERARGLTKIAGNTFHIETDNGENSIIINRSVQYETGLIVRVPRRTSVYIGGSSGTAMPSIDIGTEVFKTITATGILNYMGRILEGDISVSDVSGDIEVNAIDGDIMITGITGTIIASTIDGDIKAELVQLSGDNPLSFSSVDGDIVVALPADIKADIQMKSTDGDFYTNFDITVNPVRPKTPDTGSFMFGGLVGNSVYGTVNGGGRGLTLTTVDGDIFLRKAE